MRTSDRRYTSLVFFVYISTCTLFVCSGLFELFSPLFHIEFDVVKSFFYSIYKSCRGSKRAPCIASSRLIVTQNVFIRKSLV